MFEHEKALFDAATTKKPNQSIWMHGIFSVIISISIVIIVMIPNERLIGSIIFVVALITWSIYISNIRKKKYQLGIKNKQQFVDIFYPVMCATHRFYQQEQFKVFAPKGLQVSPRVMTDMLEDDETYHHVLILKNERMTIDIIDHYLDKKRHQRQIIMSVFHMDDGAYECRIRKQPKQSYPHQAIGSGYMMYASEQKMMKVYQKLYEKMRVLSSLHHLELTFRDDQLILTFQHIKQVPKHTRLLSKKHLQNIQDYLTSILTTIEQLDTIIKEIQS